MINGVMNFFKWMGKSIDFSDLIGLGGLGLIFYGLYQWKPFLAYIVIGGILFLLAVMSTIKPNSKIGS